MSSAGLAGVGEALLGWVGPINLTTALILAAALTADRLLERRVAASLRLWLYAAVLLRLALPADWHSPLGLLGARGTAIVTTGEPSLLAVAAAPSPSPGAAWAALLYLAGALLLSTRWLQVRLALRRELAGATTLGPFEGVPLVRHARLGPLVTGLLRPCIVVPAALADAGGEALGFVLQHERAHVRRRDLAVGTVVQLICLAAWPVLPVWIAARRIRALMEIACDDRAVQGSSGAQRRRYGEVLLSLAERGAERALAPELAFGWQLRGRLRALALQRRWPLVPQALVVAVTAATVLACAGDRPADEPGRSLPQVDRSPVSVKDALAPRQAQIRDCYQRHLSESPAAEGGKMVFRAVVAPTGGVSEVQMVDPGPSELRDCIVKVLRQAQFPRLDGIKGPLVVEFPIYFQPGPRAERR